MRHHPSGNERFKRRARMLRSQLPQLEVRNRTTSMTRLIGAADPTPHRGEPPTVSRRAACMDGKLT